MNILMNMLISLYETTSTSKYNILTLWIRAVSFVAIICAVVKVVAKGFLTDAASIVTTKLANFTCCKQCTMNYECAFIC